ncbi:MAG: type 4a pilus biogenesis protein PilO [Candidatus Pacebacteria bacterium]|nr:type 4a pilus biogenesis protein PilO [Candidatus Paceibacterota bacterium]
MRQLFLLIIIAVSIGAFVTLVVPRYKEVQVMRADVASFDSRLATADRLKQSREELIARYNSISKTDLDNLKILLPDTVDNIRLIIQLDSLATKNGMSSLRGVEYDALKTEPQKTLENQPVATKSYGEFTMSFTTTGQYKNFLSFISDLEQNLRLVDISAVQFNVSEGEKSLGDSLSYKITIKTYWLKK